MSNDTASHDRQKELHAARKCALKYHKYHEKVVKALMPVLLDQLAPEDRVKSKKLMRKLSTVVQWECSPDFSDEEARSGYIRRHFPHRSAQLGIILSHPDVVRLQQERSSEHELLVASLGGGPGCDAVGMVLHRNFTSQPRGMRIHVLDIEQGWKRANDVLLVVTFLLELPAASSCLTRRSACVRATSSAEETLSSSPPATSCGLSRTAPTSPSRRR